jgi:hypothetical protein
MDTFSSNLFDLPRCRLKGGGAEPLTDEQRNAYTTNWLKEGMTRRAKAQAWAELCATQLHDNDVPFFKNVLENAPEITLTKGAFTESEMRQYEAQLSAAPEERKKAFMEQVKQIPGVSQEEIGRFAAAAAKYVVPLSCEVDPQLTCEFRRATPARRGLDDLD